MGNMEPATKQSAQMKGNAMTPTLVFIRQHSIDGRLFSHGSELPPGLLSEDEINRMIDRGDLREYAPSVRRSLFKIFPHFTGCAEKQPLEQQELASMALLE